MSTSLGSAKFSDDGRELIVKGSGDVSIRIKYDDNPGLLVKFCRSITIAGTKWKEEEYGEETKTIKVGKNDTKRYTWSRSSNDRKRVKDDGHGDDINSTFFIESSTNKVKFSADERNWSMMVMEK